MNKYSPSIIGKSIKLIVLFSFLIILFIAIPGKAQPVYQQPPPGGDQSTADIEVPDDEEKLPQWKPPRNTPGLVNEVVVFNIETGNSTYLPLAPEIDSAMMSTPASFEGVSELIPNSDRVFSSLSLVTTPGIWPYTPIVKVVPTWPNGLKTTCSGTLVDSKHVFTAAHCVYTFRSERCTSPATSCWATSISVFSGYDNGSYNYASESSNMLTWTAWIVDENYDYDIAAIELKYPIGGGTGKFGYGYNTELGFFTFNTFISTGFPGETPYNGEKMYTWSGTFDRTETDGLIHTNYAYGGQSGSGVYHSDNNIVYGVLSHGHDEIPETVYTRITSSKFTTFSGWILSNRPSSFDIALFGMDASPINLDRGDPLTSASYFSFNTSSVTRSSAAYNVSMYLSWNDIISTGDTFLHSWSPTWSFSPDSGQHVAISSPFPKIPDTFCPTQNTYYLGVHVNYADNNPNNNATSGYQSVPVHISYCDMYEPDDDITNAAPISSGNFQYRDIVPKTDEDWVVFAISDESGVVIETFGTTGDTYITLYDEFGNFIENNDDGGSGLFSRIERECQADPLQSGFYYIKITSFNKSSKIYDYGTYFSRTYCEVEQDFNSYLPLILK